MRLELLRLYQVLTSLLAFVTMTSAGPFDAVDRYGTLPTFLPTAHNVTCLTHETAVLKCAIENRGTRTVVWKRAADPNPLTIGLETFFGDPRYTVVHHKHSLEWNLHIRDAKPADSGVYECQVITMRKTIRQNILLNVSVERHNPQRTPDIQISGSQYVEKGNTMILMCNATGFDYPIDELDWFKDGLKLTNGRRLHITKDVSLSTKTIVSKLNVSRADMNDAGTYVCRASDLHVTSRKIHVLNTSKPHGVRDSSNQSTTNRYNRSSSCGPLGVNILPLVTSLLIYVITS
ncbi:zwei Ig domain protein zig-8-like [Littorina saxatilis]|uniref:zwei Ig domain protein zig-8-like n=1 Tax=Littorina saxatilis TaxID=31220 RepID=UPI0038B4810D